MISFVSHLCSRGKVVRAHGCRVEGAATAARRDVVAALSKRQGAGQVAPSPENLRAGTGGEEEESQQTAITNDCLSAQYHSALPNMVLLAYSRFNIASATAVNMY